MKPPFLRTEYNYDRDEVSRETGLLCKDKTLTQQQFKDECDINTIVERFHITGQLPQLDPSELPRYDDFHGEFNFQSAMNAIRQAEETFMELPAQLRARFHNDPQRFMDFCINDENHDEAEKLGILSKAAVDRRAQERSAKHQAEIDTAVNKKLAEKPQDAPKGSTKTDT